MIFSLLFGSLSYQHVLHTLFSIIPRQSSPKLAVPQTLNLKSTSAGSAHLCTETRSSLSTLRSQACLREVSADAMVLSGPRVRSMVRWKNNLYSELFVHHLSLFLATISSLAALYTLHSIFLESLPSIPAPSVSPHSVRRARSRWSRIKP